jgi:hypothetical protein
MRKWYDILVSARGSVLMEFVMVLPVYMATLGGVLWLGFKSLDATNLRAADHWAVWMAGQRFQTRTPAIFSLQEMFPRSTIITASQKRALQDKHGYLQFIGSKTTLMEQRPGFLDNWLRMPYTATGQDEPFAIPEFSMSSTRYGNEYTQCIIMRAKASRTAKRHWDASLLADRDIWKFEDGASKYPKEWKLDLLKDAKFTDDTVEEEKEPRKINFYERYEKFEQWSK